MKVYHYTIAQHFESIIKDKEIKLATKFVNTKKEKPAVFFTTNNSWEPTANKQIFNTKTGKLIQLKTIAEHIKYCGCLVRIEINPEAAPYSWNQYVKLSGINKQYANGLKKVARKLGSDVKNFRISFQPVGIDSWLNIEILQNENEGWKSIINSKQSGNKKIAK